MHVDLAKVVAEVKAGPVNISAGWFHACGAEEGLAGEVYEVDNLGREVWVNLSD